MGRPWESPSPAPGRAGALTRRLRAGWLPATCRRKDRQFDTGPWAISLRPTYALPLTRPEILETSLLYFTCTHGHTQTICELRLTHTCTIRLHTHMYFCTYTPTHINKTRETCTHYKHAHTYSHLCATILLKHMPTRTQVRAVTHHHALILQASTNMQPLFVHTSIFAHSHHTHLTSR